MMHLLLTSILTLLFHAVSCAGLVSAVGHGGPVAPVQARPALLSQIPEQFLTKDNVWLAVVILSVAGGGVGVIIGIAWKARGMMLSEIRRELRADSAHQPEMRIEQPLSIQAETVYVTDRELSQALTTVASREELHVTEKALEQKIEARFASLDKRRSDDIRRLHEHLESTKTEIARAGEERAVKLHDRINGLGEMLGEVRGELKHLRKGARE